MHTLVAAASDPKAMAPGGRVRARARVGARVGVRVGARARARVKVRPRMRLTARTQKTHRSISTLNPSES